MPASVVAWAVGSFVADAVAGYAVFELGMGAFGAKLFAGAAQFATSSLIGSALRGGAEKSPTTSPSFTAQAQQRTHVVRSSVANRQIIYGRAMVSGPLVFASCDADNSMLHLVIALAGHEVDAIEEVYLNDEPVSAGKFNGLLTLYRYLGTPDQVADPVLVANGLGWTEAHRLRGVAYLYIALSYNRDVFPTGIPNVKAAVRGKKLYDPRTGLTVWSQNVALAVRDYLSSGYGLASTPQEIDESAIIACANICDETVTLASGDTEARYTCNGVLDTGTTPRANMEGLLSACGGALTWPSGLWTLHVAAYDSPAITLTEDSLAGPVHLRARVPRQDLYNAVKGTYVDPLKYWQPGDFPPITNATYAEQDGATIWRDIALPMTTSSATAQRLAKIMVEKSRQGITVDFPAKLSAFKVATWDNVLLSLDQLGWASKVFKVTEWRFNEAGSVNLTLQEEAAACYTWSAEETIADPAPDTNLPDPRTVATPGTPDVVETLFQTSLSAGVKSRATMSWPALEDAFVVEYRPEYRLAGDAWTVLPVTSGASVDINDIAPGSYEFRVRARNVIGVSSSYSDTKSKEVLGLTAAPAAITGFSVIKSAGFALAAWALTDDLDVRIGGRVVIRHSPLTSGAVWENGVIVEEFNGDAVSGSVPLMTGTYMAKARDSSGNYSADAVSFVATEGMVTGWTTVATSTQHTAFTGSKTNTVVSASTLRLDSLALIDSMGSSIDAWPYIDSLGGIYSSGSYVFAAYVDLTTVVTRRFEADIAATSFDAVDLIDSKAESIDEWPPIDGGAINDCDVTLYASTTQTDPAGSPVWSDWMPFFVADFTCRAAKFKLDLASGSATHNIAVSTLAVDIKVPV